MSPSELNRIIQGDALESLKLLSAESIDCCVTSPIDIYNITSYMEYVRRCVFCGPDRRGRVRENQEIGLPNEKCKIWGLQKPTVLPRDINKDGNPGTSSEIKNQIRGVVLSGEASGRVSEVVQIEQNSSCLASEQPASDRSGKSNPAVFDCETQESVESHSVGRSEEDEGQEKAKQWGVSQSAVCPGNGGRNGELDDPEQRTQLINKIFRGDALEVLKTFPDNFIDCCICSPPYYGLRDYGVAGQIGLEPTPEAYVARLVEVFREVRRVLKPEGTLWLNLGDSFASGKGTCFNPGGGSSSLGKNRKEAGVHPLDRGNISDLKASGLKPKDLIGIPWMVAFALRADGWYLRSDIIWQKPNCMPESVTDRPTKSHEYLFLLSKSQRYFYDAEAIKEPYARIWDEKNIGENNGWVTGEKTGKVLGRVTAPNCGLQGSMPGTGRNKRTVWTIPTKPFPGSHFAVMPEKLVEPCILAGTSERGYCPACGKPWARQVENNGRLIKDRNVDSFASEQQISKGKSRAGTYVPNTKTIGWLPSCQCVSKPRPGIVLDPFSGAGTVALVAKKLGRSYIGIELNPEYLELAQKRIASAQPPLSSFIAEVV